MINKYKQQICLGAFTIIIVTIFIIMMIRTNNSRIIDFNQTSVTTTAVLRLKQNYQKNNRKRMLQKPENLTISKTLKVL